MNKSKIIILAVLILVSGCTSATKNFESGVIPTFTQIETAKVDENRNALISTMKEQGLELQQTGAGYKRVKNLINKLSVTADVTQELDVYTVDAGEEVNAFAMGGNTIVVYQELIDRLPKDDELVVVLSHELAHILGQHNFDNTESKRSTGWAIASAVVGVAVTIATNGNSAVGDLAEASTATVGTGLVRSYGRAMEHEADHIGMLLMAETGYDPVNAINVWGKADTILGKSSGVSFFSSHPSHGNRKERLENDYVLAKPIYDKVVSVR